VEQKFIVAAACPYLRTGQHHEKLLNQKHLLPIGPAVGFLTAGTEIQVKLRDSAQRIQINNDARMERIKDTLCLKLSEGTFNLAAKQLQASDYLMGVFEGSTERATAILYFFTCGKQLFENLEQQDPSLRLAACDLPPSSVTVVDVPAVRSALYNLLAKSDPQLFSVSAQRFLSTPHVLTHLFAHVMSLASSDNISYISTLRVIADQLRTLLLPRIRKLEKDHHKLWHTFYGDKLSFLDGGVTRIVSLPGVEPMGIRVGIYTVTPGERDPEKREAWQLHSHVIGDVVNDRSVFTDQNYRTDTKRLQEASRFILESLGALRFIDSSRLAPSKLLLVHGPLQNPFVVYDETEPSYVPGVSKEFLSCQGISEKDVKDLVRDIPPFRNGGVLWNGCIAVYLYIMKRLWSAEVPILGVVERAPSASLTRAVIERLIDEERIPRSTGIKLRERILRYEIGDELLFGCILEEGEYLLPFELQKQFRRRAHPNWQPVIDQFPRVNATMIKCSAVNFPFRVEMSHVPELNDLDARMSLLYHMSLLLPNYVFPVGIDIADKYVKIPDWLSKGVSERLTASVLKRVLETGDSKTLMQVRRLLAMSPRDFFFRPKA
jgi:hypothetical protein